MRYTLEESETEVVLQPEQSPVATVLWLHGLGADGHDFVPIVSELGLAAPIRWVFPHAPHRPITWNNGYVMRGWYDIKALGLRAEEDTAGIEQSAQRLVHWLDTQVSQGFPARRLIIAGFSQGGAMALHVALRYAHRLGGLLALSTYLPLRDSLVLERNPENVDLPILMCHGRQDTVVPFALGQYSRDVLVAQGYSVAFNSYDMGHSVSPDQLADLRTWLMQVLALD